MSEPKAANHVASNTRATVSGSPVKKSLQGGLPHNPTKRRSEDIRRDMERELRGLWLGPMPVEDFMKEFLPLSNNSGPMPEVPPDLFQNLPSTGNKTMPSKLIAIVEHARLFPGLKLVDTSDHHDNNADDHKKLRPDMSAYLSTVTTSDNVTQFEAEELMFELKPPSAPAHPFKDPKSNATAEQLLSHSFETNTHAGILCRGQIASYLTEWYNRQHRKHGFVVYVANDGMRFIRADRSGAIVSRLFNWRQEPQTFAEFLWRFAHLTPGQRGHDTTVRPATAHEKGLAILNLQPWAPKKERPIVVLRVPEEDGRFHEVIAWGAMAGADSLTGRATRAWPVYDLKLEKVVFLKDAWRSLMPGMEKESDILLQLNQAGVRNVPRLVCGDDIAGHLTRTHEFISKPWNVGGTEITPRAQHRFLEDFVGKHLCHFTSSKQFMQAVYDAFIAHQDAYEKCGILHRDVSGNNVMMTEDGRGILNDWDHARKISDMANGPRQLSRSGTWHFMSVFLLEKPDKVQDLQDDIESFFYVVLYHVVRYMNHNKLSEVTNIIEKVFDDYTEHADGQLTGGSGKSGMITRRLHIEKDFEVSSNRPLNSWLQFMLNSLKEWLSHIESLDKSCWAEEEDDDGGEIAGANQDESDDTGVGSNSKAAPCHQQAANSHVASEHLKLHNHRLIEAKWRALLNKGKWPANDGPADHLSDVSPLKRTHDGDPSEFGLPFKKRRTGIHTGSALVNTMPDIFGRATFSQQRVPPRNSARPCQKAAQRSTPFPSRKFTL